MATYLGILTGSDPHTISAEGFATFLREKQGEKGADLEFVSVLARKQNEFISSTGDVPLFVMVRS